jgi:hypothetical protein
MGGWYSTPELIQDTSTLISSEISSEISEIKFNVSHDTLNVQSDDLTPAKKECKRVLEKFLDTSLVATDLSDLENMTLLHENAIFVGRFSRIKIDEKDAEILSLRMSYAKTTGTEIAVIYEDQYFTAYIMIPKS